MLEVLLIGVMAGLAVAIPLGPIGLLCIRRTLHEGTASGLATGLGAAAADATYGLLVALGFAASGVLVSYAEPMQMAGGTLIALIGGMSLQSARQPRQQPVDAPRHTLPVAFASTYVLTLSNPLTILVFTGLIAGLGVPGDGSATQAFVLVIGVFLGSALWWGILVQLTRWAGRPLTGGGLRWLDAIAGCALLIWGIALIIGALRQMMG